MKNETILLNSLFVVTTCGSLCACTERFKICKKSVRKLEGQAMVCPQRGSPLVLCLFWISDTYYCLASPVCSS